MYVLMHYSPNHFPIQCPSYLKIWKENKNENMEGGENLEFTIDFLALDLHKIEEKAQLKKSDEALVKQIYLLGFLSCSFQKRI